jgi:hypothetical protein
MVRSSVVGGTDGDCGSHDSGTGCGAAGAVGYGGIVNYVATLKGSVKITELHSHFEDTPSSPLRQTCCDAMCEQCKLKEFFLKR